MMYAVKMGMIYTQSFMEIGTGVQVVLRVCLNNLKHCHVGITDGRDLRITTLRWAQVP
jgi:hypothetical protein